MRYHYSLIPEDEPIIRDMPVYDAALLVNGELLMLGTTDPDAGADQNIAFVTAVTASAAEAVDALGILIDSKYAATAPSNVPATASLGPNYGKCIINPFAVYLAEYDQTDAVTITSTSTTTLTVGSLEDDIDGGFAYFVGTLSGVAKSLRHINTAAAGSCVMDSALTTTGAGTDTIIKILPPNHRLTGLNAEATGLTTTAAAGSGVSLHIADNYIQSDSTSIQPLRKASHKGLNSLQNAKFFADVVMLDHVYNNA